MAGKKVVPDKPELKKNMEDGFLQLPEDLTKQLEAIAEVSGFPPGDVVQFALKLMEEVLSMRFNGFKLFKSRPLAKSVVEWSPPWPESFNPRKAEKSTGGNS